MLKEGFLYILLKGKEEKEVAGEGEERGCRRVGGEVEEVETPPPALENPSRLTCTFLE